MKTFLIDEELRDKLALVTENGIFDYCQRLRNLPEAQTVAQFQTASPVPTVEELAEAIYQDNTALLTNVEARYIAKVVHKLLTPKGVKHE
jgi:hypothetical protein